MGTLTHKERDGLEEVFLSLHSLSRYEKLKNLSALIFQKNNKDFFKNILKLAHSGTKERKISQFLLKISKKKKNLSK